MAVFTRTLVLATVLLAGAFGATSGARADERCTGTFCDFYYGSSGESFDGKAAAPTAAPTPLTVPTMPAPGGVLGKLFGKGDTQPAAAAAPGAAAAAPQPASNSFVRLGGGGLLGARQERCSGTLCDVYYGSSKPEPEETPATEQAAAAPVDAAAPAEVAPRGRMRRVAIEAEKPLCASPNADPWRCYR